MTLDEYILNHSDEEGALLSALNRDANVNLLRPRMLSGHLQGRILKMFCRMLRPRPGRCQSIPEHLPFRKRERVTGIDPCKYQSDPFRFG